jgi:hypothetical protein
MKKMWCPHISCSSCTVANDIDFKFVKHVDYRDWIKIAISKKKMKTRERLLILTIE